jgi:hypothetical protein
MEISSGKTMVPPILVSAVALVLIFSIPASGQPSEGRFEGGALLTYTFWRQIGSRDVGVGTEATGIGGRFVYKLFPYIDFDTDVILLPGSQASGNRLQGFFGGKAGKRFDRVGVFLKARPGFTHFSNDPFGASNPGTGSSFFTHDFAGSTEPSIDLGGVIEYYTRRGPILRFDLGDTIIHYARRSVRVSQLQPEILAGGFTMDNWQGSFGLSFRF